MKACLEQIRPGNHHLMNKADIVEIILRLFHLTHKLMETILCSSNFATELNIVSISKPYRFELKPKTVGFRVTQKKCTSSVKE